jgi:hypothetical protein
VRAREVLADLSQGIDQQVQKVAKRGDMTVDELIDLHLKEYPADKPCKHERSWEGDRSSLYSHIRPLFEKRMASSLVPADLAKFQVDIANGKTVRKTKSASLKVMPNCAMIFYERWSISPVNISQFWSKKGRSRVSE